ncbi:MAG TPA: hypothetical protein VGE52_09255 [Pirellulales bacterium]
MFLRFAPPILCFLPALLAVAAPHDPDYVLLRLVMSAAYVLAISFAIRGTRRLARLSLAAHVSVLVCGVYTLFLVPPPPNGFDAEVLLVLALAFGPWLTSVALVLICLAEMDRVRREREQNAAPNAPSATSPR